MAEGSKSAPLIPEDSESAPLIAEYSLGETPQECSQQPIMMGCLRPNRLRDARDLARAAACEARKAVDSCLEVMRATQEAITEAQGRVEALREAEGTAEYRESGRYRALASRYDAAVQLATARVDQVKAAVESAENAATVAETAARQVVEEPNEEFNTADRLSAADNAAISAKEAAIVAYKTEYLAVKAMKRCWKDLDHGNVESSRLPTRHPEETRCGGNPNGKKIAWTLGTALLILGIAILAGVVPYTKNPKHQTALIVVGSILVAITVCGLISEIVVCIKKKCEQKNDEVMERIEHRIGELDNYFKSFNITPVNSDDEQ